MTDAVMERLLTQRELAAYLQVHVRTVRRLPIRKCRVGRSVRYRVADVERYLTRGTRRGHAA